MDVIKYCVEEVAGRIPVVAGTGSNCTETAIYLSTEAEKHGVDALLLVSPITIKATQNGLYKHYKAIADSVKIPCILYNVPSRTGCNIAPETVVRLCTEVENIVGVKEASGDISQVVKLMALAEEKWICIQAMTTRSCPFWPLAEKALSLSFPMWHPDRPMISARNSSQGTLREAARNSSGPFPCAMRCLAR